MIKKIKNFICKLFGIKQCECSEKIYIVEPEDCTNKKNDTFKKVVNL